MRWPVLILRRALRGFVILGSLLAIPFMPSWAAHLQKARSCDVLKVVDGDSLRVSCQTRGINEARIRGFDTPEIYGNCEIERAKAQLAKRTLERWLAEADEVKITLPRGVGRDRYGRLLVDVTTDGQNIGDRLIAAGLARAYRVGPRLGWCG